MDKALDWSLAQSFLTVAEAGSLSAAARQLQVTQPTLGRHIAALESRLNLKLFTRTARGLELTETGQNLLPHARKMREAAATMSLAAAGREERLAGIVRVTASRVVAHHLLPPILADLREKAPQIEIELVPSDSTENLMFRAADIALRMYRPTQLDLVARHLGDLPMAIYGAKTYLARFGEPETPEALQNHQFVGFDKSDLMLRMMARLGLEAKRSDFKLRCDDQLVYWNLVRAGAGLGGALCALGDHDPLVQRVAPFLPLPPLPLWIAAPQPLLASPRMRFVFDHLAAGFAKGARPLDPEPAKG